MKRNSLKTITAQIITSLLAAWMLYGAGGEFYQIAWGTGTWRGEFSFKWGVAYYLFVTVCTLTWLALSARLFFDFKWRRPFTLAALRARLGFFRWVLAALVIAFPVWLLQYTSWGVVFKGVYLRLLIWSVAALGCGFLITRRRESTLDFSSLLLAVLLTGLAITLAVPFANVTDYPFSLGWSEGNRMWDYSLLFGKDLYTYDETPMAYIDIGRQINGGLPFLLPNVSILQERLWIATMAVLPYVLLGLLAFRLPKSGGGPLPLLAGLWAGAFVNQGPVHAPLLWSAILVAIAWRKPLWLSIPLVVVSAYLAQASRFTWLFAPAMWAFMLEFGNTASEHGRFGRQTRSRAISVGVGTAGVLGGYFAPKILALIQHGFQQAAPSGVTVASVTAAIQHQPLLWYRLLPNATYGSGILLGLLFAVGPLLIVLAYLAATRRWRLNAWQKAAVVLPLLAFLAVGLIVSTKIGGGGDLHNMDMFIIGMMFAAALAWNGGAAEWLGSVQGSGWMRIVILVLVAFPAVQPLRSLYPLAFSDDLERLATLTDVENTRALGSLPSAQVTDAALQTVRDEVARAQLNGEVLFIDQRQLLTFGFVRDVKLVSAYEKKRMMDEALSSNASYFAPFYADLSAHRFTLIVSEILRRPIKDSSYQFGEENNAWVRWVANPILCFYEPKVTLTEVSVQLLVPKAEAVDCSAQLP